MELVDELVDLPRCEFYVLFQVSVCDSYFDWNYYSLTVVKVTVKNMPVFKSKMTINSVGILITAKTSVGYMTVFFVFCKGDYRGPIHHGRSCAGDR